MTSPTAPRACPECSAALPPGAPQALCPACLLRQALASRTAFDPAALPANPLPPPSPAEIADKFPQFEITECLGRGGMGVVYKARQKSLDRWVAIKVLAPERVGQAAFAERFAREAQTLARLNHPRIVAVYDYGQTGGLFYIVMEFVDGVNLRDLLRDGRLEPRQALAIVPPICDALQYAHDKGIVHRDIKPENLLLDREGRLKIADFGIARLLQTPGEAAPGTSATAPASGFTQAAGTPSYMAPEQAGAPLTVDHRADIYSLGVVLYELLTGELPGHRLEPPSHKIQIDVRLDAIVLRALEKNPGLRYQQASVFKTQVEAVADTGVPSAGQPAPNPPTTAPGLPLGDYRDGRFHPFWGRIASVYLLGAGASLLFALTLAVLMRRQELAATRTLLWALYIPLPATVLLVFAQGRRTPSGNQTGPADPRRRKIQIAALVFAAVSVLLICFSSWSDWQWAGFVAVSSLVFGFLAACPKKCGSECPPVSRLALAGVLWAAVAVLAAGIFFVTTYTAPTARDQGPLLWKAWRFLVHFNRYVTGPLGCAAIIGTTVLGWMAGAQTLRSPGRRRGLRLAVFAGLLFPLLALDYAIAFFVHRLGIALRVWTQNYDPVTDARLTVVSILLWVLVNSLIVRRVWRAVNAPVAAGPDPRSGQP